MVRPERGQQTIDESIQTRCFELQDCRMGPASGTAVGLLLSILPSPSLPRSVRVEAPPPEERPEQIVFPCFRPPCLLRPSISGCDQLCSIIRPCVSFLLFVSPFLASPINGAGLHRRRVLLSRKTWVCLCPIYLCLRTLGRKISLCHM